MGKLPLSARAIGWGILGTGAAAEEFATGLRHAGDSELVAVGSRSEEAGRRFAGASGARRAWASYEDLVKDPQVDVVYIASPSFLHREHCLLALRAGKAVLCEKPFAMSADEAREVISFARQRRLFCMEAMWMHFLPGMRRAIELVRGGAIGEPRALIADFGFPTAYDAQSRFYSPALGGGALLDRGVYPLSLAWQLFGRPVEVEARCAQAPTGVDEHTAAILKYPAGQIAMLSATLVGYGGNEATILGTAGRITIHEPLCRPDMLTVSHAPREGTGRGGGRLSSLKHRLRSNALVRRLRRLLPGRTRSVHVPYVGNGYNYEADEVVHCLRSGATESSLWSLDHTAGVMATLDLVRARCAA